MCFNMSIIREIEELQSEFRAAFRETPAMDSPSLRLYHKSGFSHPHWPVICADDSGKITMVRWGLIPHWIKDRDAALAIRNKTLNARGETLHRLPSFRYSFPHRTCLILADGFFEPFHYHKKSYPFFIHNRSGTPLTLGGIYSDWRDPVSGSIYRSFSIVTVPAVGIVDRIHHAKHRMPLILTPESRSAWLSNEEADNRYELVKPLIPEPLAAYPVARTIYSRSQETNTPQMLEPVHYGIPAVDNLATESA